MTERDDTEVPAPRDQSSAQAADAPRLSEREGAAAVAEGAHEAVDPTPAAGESAPAADAAAGTPERPSGAAQAAATADEHPEVLVGGAFVGGLVVALLLKRVARG